ncbi:MAG: tRNA epoxyqueuosine(34) reductase QueG [Mariprofundales bacterium]|nr:tRNA epoxyqueuosine(34) reductase QueG [Mariprofundales bacterium]
MDLTAYKIWLLLQIKQPSQHEGLAENIKQLARETGFDYCGITAPKVPIRDVAALQGWVDAGMQADMAWMAEAVRLARRKDPASLLDGVCSVISVGLRYTPPQQVVAGGGSSRGMISAYAAGDDYHVVMKKRLKVLARGLDDLLGRHDQRVFVDTAPVLEHVLAAGGGVGWQGKHSLTLNRDGGSWLLLGELFTTAKLPPDAPASGHCGSCTHCIDGCPTNAIVAPYIIDANLCLSFITIEYSGVIPRELRQVMGARIYGCDDCQMVCPWSDKTEAVMDDLLRPRAQNIAPLLSDILQLDVVGFRHHFSQSPIKRTGRTRLLRNACVAAGNSGDADLVVLLFALLDDAAALIRGHAVWALARLRAVADAPTIDARLEGLRSKEADRMVQQELAWALDGQADGF